MASDETKFNEITLGEFKVWFAKECRGIMRDESDLLCTYEQACIMLNITKATMYQYIHRKKLHPVKQNGNLQKFVRMSELNRFLTDKTIYLPKLREDSDKRYTNDKYTR